MEQDKSLREERKRRAVELAVALKLRFLKLSPKLFERPTIKRHSDAGHKRKSLPRPKLVKKCEMESELMRSFFLHHLDVVAIMNYRPSS